MMCDMVDFFFFTHVMYATKRDSLGMKLYSRNEINLYAQKLNVKRQRKNAARISFYMKLYLVVKIDI